VSQRAAASVVTEVERPVIIGWCIDARLDQEKQTAGKALIHADDALKGLSLEVRNRLRIRLQACNRHSHLSKLTPPFLLSEYPTPMLQPHVGGEQIEDLNLASARPFAHGT
jgi:hypothetical protein